MRRTIHSRHESDSPRRQMQPHALHQRVSRLLLLHGDQRRAHRLLLAEPAGGALHHPRPPTLLLQLHTGAAGVRRPAGRVAHPPHPHPRLPHAGHGGAGGLVQQAQRHPGLAVTCGVRGHGQADSFSSDLPSAGCFITDAESVLSGSPDGLSESCPVQLLFNVLIK